jgi:hypothetical protein
LDDIRIDPGTPPTAVILSALAVSQAADGVHLAWSAAATEGGDFFTIGRRVATAPGEDSDFRALARVEAAATRHDYVWVDESPESGDTVYRIGLWSHGSEMASQQATLFVPRHFTLHTNVPNPFNPQTRIAFEVPSRSHVRLAIYDVHGTLVRVLVDTVLDPGRHERDWDGRDAHGMQVASGVYLDRLESAGQSATRRMLVVR